MLSSLVQLVWHGAQSSLGKDSLRQAHLHGGTLAALQGSVFFIFDLILFLHSVSFFLPLCLLLFSAVHVYRGTVRHAIHTNPKT